VHAVASRESQAKAGADGKRSWSERNETVSHGCLGIANTVGRSSLVWVDKVIGHFSINFLSVRQSVLEFRRRGGLLLFGLFEQTVPCGALQFIGILMTMERVIASSSGRYLLF
jgi:hypothetical protein